MGRRSRKFEPGSLLEDFVFIVDECLGKSVADALRSVGAQVKLVTEEFGPGTPDKDWLPDVGRHGWLLITKDKRIRQNPVERRALQLAGVQAFFMGVRNPGAEEASAVVKDNAVRMVEFALKHEPPFVVVIRKGG
jgi:hypothetical protein